VAVGVFVGVLVNVGVGVFVGVDVDVEQVLLQDACVAKHAPVVPGT
jgi:hypothetical protein